MKAVYYQSTCTRVHCELYYLERANAAVWFNRKKCCIACKTLCISYHDGMLAVRDTEINVQRSCKDKQEAELTNCAYFSTATEFH